MRSTPLNQSSLNTSRSDSVSEEASAGAEGHDGSLESGSIGIGGIRTRPSKTHGGGMAKLMDAVRGRRRRGMNVSLDSTSFREALEKSQSQSTIWESFREAFRVERKRKPKIRTQDRWTQVTEVALGSFEVLITQSGTR